MLAAIENQIVERLTAIAADLNLAVITFPANPRSLGTPVRRSQVLVGFQSRSLERSWSEGGEIQIQGSVEFAINCELINLRTHREIYLILDALLLQLQGFTPIVPEAFLIENLTLRCSPMELSRDNFQELDDNCWYYGQTWVIPFHAILEHPDPTYSIEQLIIKTYRDVAPVDGDGNLDKTMSLEIQNAL